MASPARQDLLVTRDEQWGTSSVISGHVAVYRSPDLDLGGLWSLASGPSNPNLRSRLYARFGGYCEKMFDALAEGAPAELAGLVREGSLTASRLTYAAEALGAADETPLVANALLPLLKHPSPLVREGAIYGLARHQTDLVRRRLAEVVRDDPSPAVREAARESLVT